MKNINYHIVRTNETINKIALIYQLELSEIKSLNEHISDWEHLVPGTKLRLPTISETLQDEIDDIEPFIEEYYPRINPIIKEPIIIKEEPMKPQIVEEKKEEIVSDNKIPYYYPPYYQYPYINKRKIVKVIREIS